MIVDRHPKITAHTDFHTSVVNNKPLNWISVNFPYPCGRGQLLALRPNSSQHKSSRMNLKKYIFARSLWVFLKGAGVDS